MYLTVSDDCKIKLKPKSNTNDQLFIINEVLQSQGDSISITMKKLKSEIIDLNRDIEKIVENQDISKISDLSHKNVLINI